jgi:hypothetical protein
MKTIQHPFDSSRTITVQWTGTCFARYEIEFGVPTYKHDFGWTLTKGARAGTIFAAYDRFLERERESELFAQWVK